MLKCVLTFKNGPIPASFSFIFGLFKQAIQFLQQIYVKKCPSSIQCRDLNPQPSERETLPITSNQGSRPCVTYFKHFRLQRLQAEEKENYNTSLKSIESRRAQEVNKMQHVLDEVEAVKIQVRLSAIVVLLF